MKKAKAEIAPGKAHGRRARRAVLGLLVAIALAAPATAQSLPESETTTPQRLLSWLYLDLAELAGPRTGASAVWPDYLSRDTRRLYEKLETLDDAAGYRTFDYDWLCQCRDRQRIKVPPRISILDRPTRLMVTTQVTISMHAGSVTRLKLTLIDEGGWKIADIESEDGKRLRTEIVRGIEDHKRGRKPLHRQLPN